MIALPMSYGTKFQHHAKWILLLAVCAFSIGTTHAREYYASPEGNDDNNGTKAEPFKTLAHSVSLLTPGDTLYLREGIYRETLTPSTSGTADNPITISSYQKEKAVISGADLLSGWEQEEEGVYQTKMSWSVWDGNQLFGNGKMLSEARWPNAAGDNFLFQPNRATADGGSSKTVASNSLEGPRDAWKGAELWCAGGAAWICWTSKVSGYDNNTKTLSFEKEQTRRWYVPKKGNLFVLRGIKRAFDAPGEWFYENGQLSLIPPKQLPMNRLTVTAKKRLHAINLSGRSHIRIDGLHFRAGGILTDDKSSNLILHRLTGRYVSHSYAHDVSSKAGVLIRGRNILVLSCDFGYSSASVLSVKGQDHRIINCHIHHGGYAGLWRGTVALAGRRILFSHNTVQHAGRDLINTHGLMESLVQYNDVSDAGWLTSDLGMFYGHNTDFANTVFCYNLVHDSRAQHLSMGIYFDHLSNNPIVHHNVIWNVNYDSIRVNNPSYCALIFNNTSWRTGRIGTFDHVKREDLFASRYTDNIFNEAIRLPEHVALKNNMVAADPPFRNTEKRDFRLKGDNANSVGAYPNGSKLWKAGCDLESPPDPLPTYVAPHIKGMNMVKNSCFELQTIESWEKTDAGKAQLVKGNSWGNEVYGDNKSHATGTMKKELRLGPGVDGIAQTIDGLVPNTQYQLSAWVRVSEASQSIELGVRGIPKAKSSSSSTEWERVIVDFSTGSVGKITIYLRKTSPGGGHAWVDNLVLPL